MEKMIYTLVVAFLGGFLGIKLKIPAGALIGAMVAVAAYNISGGKGYIHPNFKVAAQIVIGGILGLSFTMETLYGLKELWVPAVVMIVGLMVLSLTLGVLISKFAGIDPITALFSSAPGGLTEMVITAEAYGADIKKVALLHLMRLITVITVMPVAIKVFLKYFKF
ncbi:MAG: AbrB family transcriptional regulator [Bacillota bacterium]